LAADSHAELGLPSAPSADRCGVLEEEEEFDEEAKNVLI